jgi:thioester reductase-like protein
VICLVRATDDNDVLARVTESLYKCGITSSNYRRSLLTCLPCDLSLSDLGLPRETYRNIAASTSVIIHAAWSVNFNLHLTSFIPQLQGLHNLIDLALASPNIVPPRFLFVSSTASVLSSPPPGQNQTSYIIPENILLSPSSASSTGYAQSKWVAEQICLNAHTQTRLRNCIFILE